MTKKKDRHLSINLTFKFFKRKSKLIIFEKVLISDPNELIKLTSKNRQKENPEFLLVDDDKYMVFKTISKIKSEKKPTLSQNAVIKKIYFLDYKMFLLKGLN